MYFGVDEIVLTMHALIIVACLLLGGATAMSIQSGRREMIGLTLTVGGRVVVAASSAAAIGGWSSSTDAVAFASDDAALQSSPFTAYKIISDSSSNLTPNLQQVTPTDLNRILAMAGRGGTVWLGEHHNSAIDHQLQANFVRNIHSLRQGAKSQRGKSNMSVGLEMVQIQFQPVLDAYINKVISASEMKSQVQWDKRWSWSFDNYLPIFETCREVSIPLIALNVDSEDLGLVELGGFPNLPREKLQKYISDPVGFAQFASMEYYKTYVDYVISPSYDMHKEMGILRTTITGQQLQEDMSFARFVSGRILWDEGMASNAYEWTKDNVGGLMIGLVGADHVKFNAGIPGRYQRMVSRDDEKKVVNCISVRLNPSLIDTRPSGSVSMVSNTDASVSGVDNLTLQLRYPKRGVDPESLEGRESSTTGGVLLLADYIVQS